MKSIRLFLIITLIATITMVNVLSSVHGYSESMKQADKIFDDQLLGYANVLSAIPWKMMKSSEKLIAQISLEDTMSMQLDSNIACKVWDDDQLDINCSSFGDYKIDKLMEPGYRSINFNGYRWRALYLNDLKEGIKILVAERDDKRFIVSEKIVLESIFPIIIILPVIALLIWIIVGVGLAPVSKLAANFRKKQVTDLSPIELTDVPKELTLLASSANDLLFRLEQSFEREKRFAADAAHELRTPITALKLHIQNLFIELKTQSSEQSTTIELLKYSIDRMGHLVEQILSLNRTSPDLYMANFIVLDLVKLTQYMIAQHYNSLEMKQLSIELKSVPCQIVADQFGIETLLSNLLSNAIKYTHPKGKIEIELSNNSDNFTITIMDSGPGIPIGQRDRVFERFYRIDGDRNNTQVIGCGLGLSIVKHIVELHKASISLSDSDFETGLKITISIPKNII